MKSSFCIDLQRFMLIHTKFPLTRFLICFSTPRDDISIFIAISAADIVGLFFIKSSILSELFLSELFEVVSELFLFLSELFEAVSELNNWKSLFLVSYFCNLT